MLSDNNKFLAFIKMLMNERDKKEQEKIFWGWAEEKQHAAEIT